LEQELRKFDPGLMEKPRWLVFTKADLLLPEEARERAQEVVAELEWDKPWMLISSVTRSNMDELMQSVSAELETLADEQAAAAEEFPDPAEFPEESYES